MFVADLCRSARADTLMWSILDPYQLASPGSLTPPPRAAWPVPDRRHRSAARKGADPGLAGRFRCAQGAEEGVWMKSYSLGCEQAGSAPLKLTMQIPHWMCDLHGYAE